MTIHKNEVVQNCWGIEEGRSISGDIKDDTVNKVGEIGIWKSTKLEERTFGGDCRYIVHRNTRLGNTIIIFVILQICWKSGHMEETVHDAVMSIKFSKQIANSFANMVNDHKGEFKTL